MIQIYTGDGKGKTTAALGLALRAIGAKKKVAILQFLKKGDSSEFNAIKKYKLPIDVFAYGIGFYKILNDKHSHKEHTKAATDVWEKAKEIIKSKKYDLIILDEINVAIDLKLIDINDVINNLHSKPLTLHPDIILTGRGAPAKLKKIADLITVMKKEKHYFNQKIKARKGIEY